MSTTTSILKAALAATVRSTAEWRKLKAEEYAGDERNAQCAAGLEDLAVWIEALDDTDARLVQLAALDWADDFFSAGEEPSRLLGRYRFDREDESPDQFLDRFVEACIQEAMVNADEPFDGDIAR